MGLPAEGIVIRAMRVLVVLAFVALCLMPSRGHTAEPFARGWTLDAETSFLRFQSVKNGSKVEISEFATFAGQIDETGVATLTIALDSVDTGVDLRNVRMRFLFFETFRFPEAKVRVEIDRAAIADLATRRRMTVPVRYTLDLHGVEQTLETDAVVTLITDTQVSVASSAPIPIATALFGLDEGVRKLEDAAKVTIVPSGSVSFDFVFNRNAPRESVVSAALTPSVAAPASAAVETSGDFSVTECAGRFEILSRTGAIYFKTGSADLDGESGPLLRTVLDIVQRCPGLSIQVAGHTDSAGSAGFNQSLSEARAASVQRFLIQNGIAPDRVRAVGFGESRPVAPNDSDRNRSRNRRIEFSVAPS